MKPSPNCSPEAERAVLSSMMRDNRAIADVVGLLREGDFYADAHQRVWRAIVGLWNEGKPADVATTAEHLKRSGDADNIGGYQYLTEVYHTSGTSANAVYYADIVRDHSICRQLYLTAQGIAAEAEAHAGPAGDILASAERQILALARDGAGDDIKDTAELVSEAFTRIDQRMLAFREGRTSAGLSTGFVSLDSLLAGWHPGELTIVGARPGVGKTTFALAVSLHAAVEQQRHVLFVSLEQKSGELIDRALCNLAPIGAQDLRLGKINDADGARLHAAGERLRLASLCLSDAPTQPLLRIAGAARRAKQRRRCDVLIVDYLQLIQPENRKEPRQEQVASISRGLKHLARDLAVPVVCLSQLNRESEQRAGQWPRLADLRESGAIEADADNVLLLHREEKRPDELFVIVAKQRNGPTETIILNYDRSRHCLTDPCSTPWDS